MSKNYIQIEEGVWVDENWSGNLDQCCDCGLVHKIDYRIKDGKLQSRCRRVERNTAQIRRFNKIKVKRKNESV